LAFLRYQGEFADGESGNDAPSVTAPPGIPLPEGLRNIQSNR
jgi:hypothetical protein